MATSLPTDLILPHLRELNRNAADLREIRLMWRLIEASARMQASQQGQALVSMLTDTRQGLEQLEQGLLQSQLAQSAQEAMAQLGMQSSHAIDLLVLLETDERLDALLERLEAGETLSAEEQSWVDAKLDRIDELMQKLGLSYDDDEEEEEDEKQEDMMRLLRGN